MANKKNVGKTKKNAVPFSAVVNEEELQKAVEKMENKRTDGFVKDYRALCAKYHRQLDIMTQFQVVAYDPTKDAQYQAELKKEAEESKSITDGVSEPKE